MLLKTFEKVNNSVSTNYEVYNANGEFIEDFLVDYRVNRLDTPDLHYLNIAINKRKAYEKQNAKVKFVTTNNVTNRLEVTIISQ